tara:strand:- start:812 stop:1258 length:447 start_codon:yes stop_codon:yes gene_type:complete
MTIYKRIDKILAAFGNIKALERTHIDTHTEALIQNIPGDKIAESKDGQFWGKVQNLAGFYFLETIILSRTNIKTVKGGKLYLKGKDNSLTIDSDTKEIASDYSNISKRWMTRVSYIVSKEEIKYLNEHIADEITFQYKRKSILFKVIK